MQEPKILGILIGLCFIGTGWLLGKLLLPKVNPIAGGITFVILAYIGALLVIQSAFFSYPSSWTWPGAFMVWVGFIGNTIGPIALAFTGLVYRPNKVTGYTVALVALTGLMVLGNTN